MKKHRRTSRRRRQKRKRSKMAIIIFTILAIVLIGDVVGAVMYLRQTPDMQESLMIYVTTGDSLSFFQIFWQQFLYQLTIWTLGATLIGNIINLFLIFVRGVSAGFNLAVLIEQDIATSIIVLWLIQYLLILFTTILSVYFSLRFAYLMVMSLAKKKVKLIKKYIKLYVMQLMVILLLTLFTAMTSAVVTPIIQNYLTHGNF